MAPTRPEGPSKSDHRQFVRVHKQSVYDSQKESKRTQIDKRPAKAQLVRTTLQLQNQGIEARPKHDPQTRLAQRFRHSRWLLQCTHSPSLHQILQVSMWTKRVRNASRATDGLRRKHASLRECI